MALPLPRAVYTIPTRSLALPGDIDQQAAANVANVCNAPVADQVLF